MSIVDKDEISRMAQELASTAAAPEFLELVRMIRDAPPSLQLDVARGVADSATLQSHGINPPEHFRISPRTFEDPPVETPEVAMPHLTWEDDRRAIFEYAGRQVVIEVEDGR